jgi:hypothetical protein
MKKYGVSILLLVLALICIPAISTQAQTNSTSDAALPAPETTAAPFSATHSINLLPDSLTPARKPAASHDDNGHHLEVFLGYSFLSNNIAVVDDDDFRQGVHGYAASVSWFFNKNIALTADFSGHNGSQNFGGTDQDEDQYYFIFGPTIAHQIGSFRISGNFGAGVARQHYSENFSGEFSFGVKQTNFAMRAGGALDWMGKGHWGIRIVQMDYLFSEFDGTSGVNNLRVSAGIIFRCK